MSAGGSGRDYPEVDVSHPDDAPPTLLGELRTGDWLDEQTFPPLAWVVPGLIPEGLSLLVGGPKIGKSWLSLDVALAVAAGGVALGTVTVGAPRPVLLLALEDGHRRLQDRCRKLLGDTPIPAVLSYMTRIQPGQVIGTVEEWLRRLEPDERPLVILDTLGKIMPPTQPGEGPYQRDYRVAGRLKRITDERPGMALLACHHDRKAQADDFVESSSGTNGITGAMDTVIVIARARTEERGLLKVTGRDVTEREYAVTVTDGRWRLMGSNLAAASATAQTIRATVNLSDRSAEIVRFVAHRPDGTRAADVAAALDIAKDEAGIYLRRLTDAGRLRKPERGLYMPVLSVLSVLSDQEGTTSKQNTRNTKNSTTQGVNCSECGFPLAAALVTAGETTHATCGDSA